MNLYLYEQGSRVKSRENRIIIETENLNREIPINAVENVVLFGKIEVTSSAITACMQKGIILTWLSSKGKFFGRLESTSYVNVMKQKKQMLLGLNDKFVLEISKKFIYGKAHNQLVSLKRKFNEGAPLELEKNIAEIEKYIQKIPSANSLNSLLGYEGSISKSYFQGLSQCVKKEFKFHGRSKRPPKDPFNSMISFGYTLLLYEIYTSICSRGLHPYFAFLHRDKQNHPALCSDLMEEWRAVLVDSLARKLINKRQVKIDDFTKDEQTCGILMSKKAVKLFIKEFEKNMRRSISYIAKENIVTNYRKAIDYQVKLLVKAIDNEDANIYEPVMMR